MKSLKGLKIPHFLKKKYTLLILAVVVIGTASVAALSHIPDHSASWSRTPTSALNDPNTSNTTPSNVSNTGNPTPNTGSDNATSPSASTQSSQSGIEPNTATQTPDTSPSTATTPSCNTTAEAQDQTAFQNAYNTDLGNTMQAINATGYSAPFPPSSESVIMPIEENFNNEWTNLKINWGNEMNAINCTNSPPAESGLNFPAP